MKAKVPIRPQECHNAALMHTGTYGGHGQGPDSPLHYMHCYTHWIWVIVCNCNVVWQCQNYFLNTSRRGLAIISIASDYV